MIRQPTPRVRAYAWWRRALADPRLPRIEAEPECGYFRLRMVKGGPWVPASITLRQEIDEAGELAAPEEHVAEILGRPASVARVWGSGRPISRQDYLDLVERHSALPAMAATHAAVDVSATPMLPGGAR